MEKPRKECSECGSTKAVIKHHLLGGGKGPTIPRCIVCEALAHGVSDKSLRKRHRRLKKRIEWDQECLSRLEDYVKDRY